MRIKIKNKVRTSFKTHSQISSLATTQIFYSHYNLAYLTVENQSQ